MGWLHQPRIPIRCKAVLLWKSIGWASWQYPALPLHTADCHCYCQLLVWQRPLELEQSCEQAPEAWQKVAVHVVADVRGGVVAENGRKRILMGNGQRS